MPGTRKGFGNVEKTHVTSFGSLIQFHKEVHGLLQGGATLTTTRLSVTHCCIYGLLYGIQNEPGKYYVCAVGCTYGLIRGFQTLPSAPQSWDRSHCSV